jgi:hypothetical protein
MSETELEELPLWKGMARWSDPSTSRGAVTKNDRLRWKSQQAKILLSFYQGNHHRGFSDEEAGYVTGLLQVRACYRKRCGELREKGYLAEAGETRESSFGKHNIVSRITDKGIQEVERLIRDAQV